MKARDEGEGTGTAIASGTFSDRTGEGGREGGRVYDVVLLLLLNSTRLTK